MTNKGGNNSVMQWLSKNFQPLHAFGLSSRPSIFICLYLHLGHLFRHSSPPPPPSATSTSIFSSQVSSTTVASANSKYPMATPYSRLEPDSPTSKDNWSEFSASLDQLLSKMGLWGLTSSSCAVNVTCLSSSFKTVVERWSRLLTTALPPPLPLLPPPPSKSRL